MERVYMLGGLRSHIGVRNGIFRDVPAERLAAGVLRALRERYPAVGMPRIFTLAMPSGRAATSRAWRGCSAGSARTCRP